MPSYPDTLTDQNGAPIAGAAVLVSYTSTGINAALFDNNGNPTANPLITDSLGFYKVNTQDGVYNLTYRYGGRIIGEVMNVFIGAASSLPVGTIINSLGTATNVAPSQAAVMNGLAGKADLSSLAGKLDTTALAANPFPLVGGLSGALPTHPVVQLGSSDQSLSSEYVEFWRSVVLNSVDFQVSAVFRDKTNPNGSLTITGMPFVADGVGPWPLGLRQSGLPADARAYITGDTISFETPDGTAIDWKDIGDTWSFTVSGNSIPVLA